MLVCSAVMGLGTSVGGYRIIKAVGMDMVKLKPYQGFSADLAATACLLLSSLTGIPVSTTHTKTTAIMGVGAARRLSQRQLADRPGSCAGVGIHLPRLRVTRLRDRPPVPPPVWLTAPFVKSASIGIARNKNGSGTRYGKENQRVFPADRAAGCDLC